jgi:uncharacterized protein
MYTAIVCTLWSAAVLAATDQSEVVVQRNVPARMRDGVILRADVYRPRGDGIYPVLLLRTPYGKHTYPLDRHAKAGYIAVSQDVRGRYESEGTWESFVREHTHDAEDGYDSVQWAAGLPGSSGKVGTLGFSYSAYLQWRLALLRPPALAAMSAQSQAAHYTDLEGPGTIRPGRRLRWWIVTLTPELRRRTGRPGTHTEAEAAALWDAGQSRHWLDFLPWIDLPQEVFDDETPYLRDWLRHPQIDPWKLDQGCREIEVPNLDVVGWYDHAKGDMLMHRTLVREGKTETARNGSRLVIGPWSHYPRGGRRFGSIDFGPEADVDQASLEIRFFDYWLKGKPNGLDRERPVRIFVMGDNRWRDEPCWPPGDTRQKTLFLESGEHANTPAGDGRLVEQCPGSNRSDRYVYDPHDPVPTLFGPGNFTCVTDQRPLAARRDILVYQTEPLQQRLEVTGNPSVELYAVSSAPDTDWVVRLIDVAPDGLARDLCMGLLRARYRAGLDKPQLIEPGNVVKYEIRMDATSNAFLPGHRIRLDVTSSDFPNYDRNHNTAADPNVDATLTTAEQTVHHGGVHASRIILPWLPCPERPGETSR